MVTRTHITNSRKRKPIAEGPCAGMGSVLQSPDGLWLWFSFTIREDDPKREGESMLTTVRFHRDDAIAFANYVKDQVSKEQPK